MMDTRAIRRRCEARIDALHLPHPFDLPELCAWLADRRGRPIVLRAMPLTRIAYGICLRDQDADYILYERDTSQFHQQHIILHKIGHLICGHHATNIGSLASPSELLEDLNLDRLQAVLQRASYSAEEEREAELLATLLEQRLSGASRHRTTPLSDRLAASFDDRPPTTAASRGGRK